LYGDLTLVLAFSHSRQFKNLSPHPSLLLKEKEPLYAQVLSKNTCKNLGEEYSLLLEEKGWG
jgi:hypothetical protein